MKVKPKIIAVIAAVALASAAALYFYLSMETPPNPVQLLGSGATFPMEQIQAWIVQVRNKHSWVQAEYAGGGSGKGQSDFLQGIVDFAASDPPLKTADWEKAKNAFGGVYQLPMILGGVAVVYNIPEIPSDVNLKLTGEVLVDILLGKIEYWNDPRIAELNPGVNLPRSRITFVHRSDSSGTTEVFTTYLSLVSGEWKTKVGAGKLVKWPLSEAGFAVGAPGNPGVAEAVRTTPYSLGYVELAYAKGLGVAALRNRAGRFVLPTADTIKAAAAGAITIQDASANLVELKILERLLQSQDPNAYPIVSPSYLLIKHPSAYTQEKRKAIAVFLDYIFTDGQKPENIVAGYVPVPESWAKLGQQVAAQLRDFRG
ncbi:MAG: phosphate ABC transporter substrate-binding protein PstS [Thermofilaceae archaeon]|nr:phosphate ABC transporter substrate-binding protein PstS [Thermofilaceae archaeon]MCX8179794.1 phosphate ABC transporter substrate-binding protein PstS [Thermofilaceae archaeon]MDW8004321.1 phosphate ABC transporter substrate-binding protein PstS [Thermofilaceae archaeon]